MLTNTMTKCVAKPHGVLFFFYFFFVLTFFLFKITHPDPPAVSGTQTNRYSKSSIGNSDDNRVSTKKTKRRNNNISNLYLNISGKGD